MRMKGNFISLISVIFIVLVGMVMTGCGVTSLYKAAKLGDINAVKSLIEQGADVNAEGDRLGFTALHTAAGNGHANVVALLIEKGADVNVKGGTSRSTPLTFATIGGYVNIAKLLIDKGADIDMAIVGLGRYYDGSYANAGIKFLEKFTKKQEITSQPVIAKPSQEVFPIIKSDIDELPATKAKPNKNSYAIVIGIEQYRQKLPKADFAVSDAQTMTEYLTKVMGYPEENVITLLNDHAAKSDMEKYFEKWLWNNVEKDGTVFIYYSGHGAPNPKTGDAFLVPYDGDPAFIDETGYSLKRLYEKLGKLQAKEIVVALDSCFSGAGGRSVIAKGARPLVMQTEKAAVPSNVAVLSAASGEQISSTYEEKGHGLFTYFMLKGIKGEGDANNDGKIEIGELFEYIKPQVERIARKVYNNEQAPQLIAPDELMKQRLIER